MLHQLVLCFGMLIRGKVSYVMVRRTILCSRNVSHGMLSTVILSLGIVSCTFLFVGKRKHNRLRGWRPVIGLLVVGSHSAKFVR